MLLVIDVGNTNIVFALYDADRLIGKWRAASDTRKTADEYAVWLTQLFALHNIKTQDIGAAILASVVPAITFNIVKLCEAHFQTTPFVIGEAGVALDIHIDMDNPKEVGADRLVNAVAGRHLYGAPLIVLDFGTATTFDVVSAKGDYLGGIIAPAANHSVEALHRVAAKLPKVDIVRTDKTIGKNTIAAMQSGIFWGYIGLIEGLVKRISDEYGQKMKTVATGGLAGLYADATDVIDHVDSDLTLTGLRMIYDHNC